ncbi:MAG TPA: serine hydrolase domain-containing protein [Gemmatimonadaceae bacterium]|nr:serine hydrolase domain-containing protein [Gemmatimonadaceae bacterium]
MTSRRSGLVLAAVVLATRATAAQTPNTDSLDAFVRAQMRQRHIAGLSLAVVQGGRIVYARGYGVTDPAEGRAVDTTTLFQAGSISKPTSALAALHLVEQGKLSLDDDVNRTLTSWHVAATRFTADKPVTLRGLLTHTAGLTVHGFPGYDADSVRPTLVQVLNGTPPANTVAIVNDTFPGALNRYSGGGYTIMQQMMVDVTGTPFPKLMHDLVLQPLGMRRSSFEQPLPPDFAARTAAGHYQDGSVVHARWHVYPEMAAAGLWTTASDLVHVAMAVQQAYAGTSDAVISQSMARQMLTPFMGSGLGFGVRPPDNGVVRFGHSGRDEGFDALLWGTTAGQAYAIMINANDDSRFMRRIADYIERAYGWPGARPQPSRAAVPVAPSALVAVEGLYDTGGGGFVTFVSDNGWLYTSTGGALDEQFVPIGADTFASAERDARLTFVRDSSGQVVRATLAQGASSVSAPRLGPLFGRAERGDLDASTIAVGDSTLRAFAAGTVARAAHVTSGLRADFGGPWPEVAGLRDVHYVGSTAVTGGAVTRHGGPVARLGYYRVDLRNRSRLVVVYFTPSGDVTDVDVVDR